MYINPRTYDILMVIRKVAFDEHSFAMSEILKRCSTASEDAVKTIARRVRKGADALPYAHFFDIMYTDEDVRRFIEAFEEAAPDDYVQEADLSTSMPWCMPWTWENAPLSAEEDDTPESLARRYVGENYDAIKRTFRDWKEDDRARIVQDIWDAYYNDREIPSGYKHQAGLFWKAFKSIDSIDEMGGNTVEDIDGAIDQIAEEISDSFIKAIF